MMKKNLIIAAYAALCLIGCKSGLQKGEGGLLYQIHDDKGGKKIEAEDFIAVNMVVKTEADSVLLSTYQIGHPFLTYLPISKYKGDFNAALHLLGEGDSATIKTNIDSVYQNRAKPNYAGHYINYEVKILKVISKASTTPEEFNGQAIKYKSDLSEMLRKAEPAKMKKYIDENKLKGATTPSGIFYAITKAGTGEKAVTGDSVTIHYTARSVINNKVLFTTVKDVAVNSHIYNPAAAYTPMSFILGKDELVPAAWNEGLQFLNKGAQATFVVPYKLTTGKQKKEEDLSPYIPVVFEIEMVNIKHDGTSPNTK